MFQTIGTIALISHASKFMLKILCAGFSITQTKNLQMSKLDLEIRQMSRQVSRGSARK